MQSINKHCIARNVLLAAMALSTGVLCAQPTGAPSTEGQQNRPQQEAFDACKALKAGQECSFTSPHGTVKGSCFAPEGKPLACRPTSQRGGTANDRPQMK